MQAITLATAALAAAGIVAAVTLFALRRNARRARAAFILRYAFPARLEARVRELHPHLDAGQAALAIEGLRQYFLACLAARRGGIARHVGMPSKAVDDAWHEFLLLERDYASFCRAAFGRHLAHVPDEKMSEPIGDALANTLHQLRRASPAPGGWAVLGAMPLLFAIDRELGVDGGYRHDANTLLQLETRRARKGASSGGDGGSGAWYGACAATSSGGHHCDAGSGGCDSGSGGSCGGGACGSS